MKKITAIILPLLISACATVTVSREPSTYLMNTVKPQTETIAAMQTLLLENKYEIKAYDLQSGIVVSKARPFTYGKEKSRAKHTVQMRQEGGSFSVRISYECEYSDKSGKDWMECNEGDDDLEAKIKRIETSLVHAVRKKIE